MHLSLLSDMYLTDGRNDVTADAIRPADALAHRNGVLRGLAVMVVAGVLMGLTALSTTFHSAAADTRPCGRPVWQAQAAERAQPETPVQAAVWWEANDPFRRSAEALRPSTSLNQAGTAVTLVALRQRFRSVCR